jgi:hypothetical protein
MATIRLKRRLLATVGVAWVMLTVSAVIAVQPEMAPDEVGISVTGIVRDPQGRPLGNSVVVAAFTPLRFDLPPVVGRQVVKAGPDGRFRITLVGHEAIVPQSRLTFCAYKEPFSPISLNKLLSKPDLPPPPKVDRAKTKEVRTDSVRRVEPTPLAGDVELVLGAAAPFVGTVKDQAGRPIEGASVRFATIRREAPDGTVTEVFPPREEFIRGTPLEPLYLIKSDKAGKFRFPALPPGSRLLLLVEANGMADVRTRPFGSGQGDPLEGYLAGTEERPAEIVLEPEAKVTGRVVTKLPGVKTSGLKVFVQDTDASRTHKNRKPARTDADGRFILTGLDETTVNIFLVDHPAAGGWTYRAIQDAELTPGQTKDVEIELIRGVLAEGTVIDQAGRPVADAHVGLYGPMRPRSGAAIIGDRTDRDGRYRFRVPPGETYFYVSGPPEGYTWLPQEGSSQLVEIPDDVTTFRVPPIPVRSVAEE